MKEQIKKIRDKIAELRIEINQYEKALEALRFVCDHKWVDKGHDHKWEYEECSICGKENKY